ncbi:MAG: hypothetical protein R1F54_09990 [Candidatus Zeuxoniibacter abyssi]|nr:MAG: hypothetical protein R1F54_09990 [Candidatus Persebacteraceae bacterium AB1(2)]
MPDLLNWHGFYAPYCVFQQDKIITRKFSLAIVIVVSVIQLTAPAGLAKMILFVPLKLRKA